MPEKFYAEAQAIRDKFEELLDRLRALAGCQDLERLNTTIEECEGFGMRASDMQSTLTERNKLAGLLSRLKDATSRHDIQLLTPAIEESQAAGMPENYLADAVSEKARIERMLARLGVAAQLQDLEVLKAALEECAAAGLPERDLEGATLTKLYIERMLAKLKAAIDLQDMHGVKAAIQDCGVDMVKMAIEQARSAGVAQSVLEEAMLARERDAASLPEEERRRVLQDLESCNDSEKREKYNRAVGILHDAIQSGKDVPPEFEQLLNDLIVSQVM
jgi:hypothetical protein